MPTMPPTTVTSGDIAASLLAGLCDALRDYYGRLTLDLDRVAFVEVLEEHGIDIVGVNVRELDGGE